MFDTLYLLLIIIVCTITFRGTVKKLEMVGQKFDEIFLFKIGLIKIF